MYTTKRDFVNKEGGRAPHCASCNPSQHKRSSFALVGCWACCHEDPNQSFYGDAKVLEDSL